MMNRSGIETYELLRLDEVALAGYFDLEDTRFEEWYEKEPRSRRQIVQRNS